MADGAKGEVFGGAQLSRGGSGRGAYYSRPLGCGEFGSGGVESMIDLGDGCIE
jgi:hypothetical protein